MSDPAELRQHARTDFLAAQHDADSLPGWVFKPVQFSRGPAGLVLNMSDGGLQVLTSAAETLTESRYEVVLLLGRSDMDSDDEQVSWFNGVVERAWSRPVPRMGILHGMRFVARNSTAEQFLNAHREGLESGQWVRCLLLKAAS
ncbi:hypothetical protein [Roseateles saccharophilus]|uniref:PilZ domain-containing protein n=1 Tax=Roseateles saccharophilus TaxID=304 RepID=A0A4R3VG88_ROSSA|nr:hypothetical protein [Roseateles saccharophilus]MDG0831327.1 hypothetical protein [Roseateles saccharophilus]TCV04457.1 hypothetical protein EV671_1001213 [Roseateles saccharophilus]